MPHDDPRPGRDVFIARQPIYDGNSRVDAYELLFRRGDFAFAGDVDLSDSASVLTGAMVELGLERLVGAHRAFVNVPEELLVGDWLQILPPDRVVIELLETIRQTEQNVRAVTRLKDQGYTIALDDYVLEREIDALIDLADIVKVDVVGVDPAVAKSALFKLRKRGIKLLAEKVETHEMHRRCRSLGFELFQGYYLARPELMRGRGVPSGASLTRFLAKLEDPLVSLGELDGLISTDVSLSYRLLKLVRSAYIGVGESVSSVAQALAFLGTRRTLALVSLLALTGLNDKPDELLIAAMIRARLCELMATEAGHSRSEVFFTVGLLSVLDALLDMTMEAVVAELPLPEEVNAALSGRASEGPLASALSCCIAIERGDWDAVKFPGLPISSIGRAYMDAVQWAAETNRALAA